jgi:hypothetical protein
MFALGLGILFIGYSVGLYGYIVIRGYDVSFLEMFAGPWPPTVGASAQFKTSSAVGTQTLLTGSGITTPDQTPANAGAGPGGSTALPGSGNGATARAVP